MSSERGSRKRNIDIGDNTSFPQWFSDPKNDDEEPEREKDLEEEKVQPSAPLTLSALMSSLWDEIKKNQETAMGNFGGYNADVLDLEPIRTDTWYTDATVDALIGIVLEANPGRGISFIANMYIRPCLVPFDAAAQHSRCMLSVSSAVCKRRWRTKMNFPPIRNISDSTTSIIFVLNPTSNHWLTVHISSTGTTQRVELLEICKLRCENVLRCSPLSVCPKTCRVFIHATYRIT